MEGFQINLDFQKNLEAVKEDIEEKAQAIKKSTQKNVEQSMDPLEEYTERDKQELDAILRNLSNE